MMYAVKFRIKLVHPDELTYQAFMDIVEMIRAAGAADAHRLHIDVELTGDDLFQLGVDYQCLAEEIDAYATGAFTWPEREGITVLHAGSEVAAR